MEGFINWREEWLSGIETLDQQHRVLAGCLNRLVAECSRIDEAGEEDPGGRKQELLNGIFDELHTKARTHFRNEEAMMLSEQYPGYAAHAREHVMLLAELKSTFAAGLREGGCHLESGILRALKCWFIGHVSGSDREFADYVMKREAGRHNDVSPDRYLSITD